MSYNPGCKVVVIDYCATYEKMMQVRWERVNNVINYRVENKGIVSSRFIFNYGEKDGDCNTVELRGAFADEEGTETTPPPHPNLHRH